MRQQHSKGRTSTRTAAARRRTAPRPNTAYSITEAAAGTTDLDNYSTSYSGACASTTGLPRGGSATCTMTNTLKLFTVITIVCQGNALHASSVTLDSVQRTSIGSSVDPTAAELCATEDARFTGKKSGTYSGSVTITP